jgi:hypothetical protein
MPANLPGTRTHVTIDGPTALKLAPLPESLGAALAIKCQSGLGAFYLGNPFSCLPAFLVNYKQKSRMMEHITRLSNGCDTLRQA